MKTTAIIILATMLMCMSFAQQPLNGLLPVEQHCRSFAAVQSSMVYICTGPESKRYHSNSNCRGLNKCSASIEKVTVAKAKSMKRTPCKICYK